MAPNLTRQLLVLSLPTLAVLLSYFWYKKKRIGARSDPGIPDTQDLNAAQEAKQDIPAEEPPTPVKTFSRSLSGVESTPIDIVLPRGSRSAPIIISDEDLDKEIEKIKSMRSGSMFKTEPGTPSPKRNVKTPTPPVQESNKKQEPVKSKRNKKVSKKMAQRNTALAEEKSERVNITTNESNTNNSNIKNDGEEQQCQTERDLQRQSSERDSANHSPSDTMLGSHSLSSISDNHSEGSNDSGKGGSDVANLSPSQTSGIIEDSAESLPCYYEFLIPKALVGKLIGRRGNSIAQIRERTNVLVVVRRHPSNEKIEICSLEGTKKDIDSALKIIRNKFPVKAYPEVTLEQVYFQPAVPTVPLTPDHLYVKLIEGINNDTILSCVVAPNHLFLQQPTHPSYPSLNLLVNFMNACYSDAESPLLPDPAPPCTVCAAYSGDMWCRAMVLEQFPDNEDSYVKLLDYGGYTFVDNSNLRQIRSDFMLLPFQAAECILANIISINEDGSWPQEAYDLVSSITKGAMICTQVADHTEEGIPLVLCYVVVNSSVIFLNQHLVDNGFARWVPTEESLQQYEETAETSVVPAAAGISVQ